MGKGTITEGYQSSSEESGSWDQSTLSGTNIRISAPGQLRTVTQACKRKALNLKLENGVIFVSWRPRTSEQASHLGCTVCNRPLLGLNLALKWSHLSNGRVSLMQTEVLHFIFLLEMSDDLWHATDLLQSAVPTSVDACLGAAPTNESPLPSTEPAPLESKEPAYLPSSMVSVSELLSDIPSFMTLTLFCFLNFSAISLGWRMSSNPRAWHRFTLESRAIKTATAKEKEPCALSRMNDGKGSLVNQNILLPNTFQAHSISTWWQFCESNVDR